MSEGTGAKEATPVPMPALNQRLKTIVEQQTRGRVVQVWGLASEVSRYRNGNVHLRLRQGKHSLACFVPGEAARALPFWIENGQTLNVRGVIQVYETFGELQLAAQQVELQAPATENKTLERLKQRAKAAGWLEPDRKRSLPRPPRVVGLIAGKRSRARGDVEGSLQDAAVKAKVVFEGARMQGPEMAREIVVALEKLNARREVDVIVIARGGGSRKELAAFNAWEVAEAIVASRAPVVTAIGHRQDHTLADMVADCSVATPSMVGGALAGQPGEEREAVDETRPKVALVAAAAVVVLGLLAVLGRVLGWW